LTKPIEGIEEYEKYLRQFAGKINYQISEFINPQIKRYGNLAVLTYNYRDAKTKSDGNHEDNRLNRADGEHLLSTGECQCTAKRKEMEKCTD
jgi:hypothetical protein